MRQHCDGIAWDGTADNWRSMRNPGRWRNSNNPSDEIVFLDISTSAAPPLEAYDFWNDAIRSRVAVHRSEQNAASLSSRDAASEERTEAQRSSSTPDRPIAGKGAGIELTLLLGLRSKNESALLMRSAGFFLFKTPSPSHPDCGAQEGVHLLLRREVVERVTGGPMPPANALAQALFEAPLSLILGNQMLALARSNQDLTRVEQDFLLNQIVQLVLFAIKHLAMVPRGERATHTFRKGLFNAAQRYIEEHFSLSDLDSHHIARGIGASRATLYRAYADHGWTVNDPIREARLVRARDMLRSGPVQQSIDSIAEICGFAYTRSFQRAFRTRFGVNPSDLRLRKLNSAQSG